MSAVERMCSLFLDSSGFAVFGKTLEIIMYYNLILQMSLCCMSFFGKKWTETLHKNRN